MKKLALILVALLLIPTIALVRVASEQAVSGQLTVGNTAPTINGIDITDTSNVSVSSINANTEYWIYISISDSNTLADIKNITVYLFHGDKYTDPPGSYALNNSYAFAWVNGSGWKELGPDSTGTPSDTTPSGYDHIPGTCAVPSDFSASTGQWKLSFKVSKIAEDTGATNTWYVNVTVYDNASTPNTDNIESTFDVNFYSEISVNATLVTWAGSPGATGLSPNGTTTYTFICNDAYNITAKGTDFTSGTNVIGVGNFTVDDDSTPDEGTETGVAELQLSTTYQTFIENVGVSTTETGDDKDFWWFADIPATVAEGTYTGTLYISVNDYNPNS